ncbi:MAG TPA: hypothetical protein VGP72_33700 [Planctomycetota bacterium]|jgi:hypothetical protein
MAQSSSIAADKTCDETTLLRELTVCAAVFLSCVFALWLAPFLLGRNDAPISVCIALIFLGVIVRIVLFCWILVRINRAYLPARFSALRLLLCICAIIGPAFLPTVGSRFLDGYSTFVRGKNLEVLDRWLGEINEQYKNKELPVLAGELPRGSVPKAVGNMWNNQARYYLIAPRTDSGLAGVHIDFGGKYIILGDYEDIAGARKLQPTIFVGTRM